jgi:PAS domain S-box-containing protein
MVLAVAGARADFTNLASIAELHVDSNHDTNPDLYDQPVRVKGIVTSALSERSGRIGFSAMQDGSGGIFLFTSNPAAWTEVIKPGQFVEISGRVGNYAGLRLLAVSNCVALGNASLPAPKEVRAADLQNFAYHGRLVKVRGKLIVPDRFSFFANPYRIEDDSGSVVLSLPEGMLSNSEIMTRILRGGAVEIQGVAGQIKERAPFDSGFCVIPRTPGDIHFLPRPPLREIAAGGCALLLLGFLCYSWIGKKQAQKHARQLANLAQQLQRSEANISALLENVDAAIFSLDSQFRLVEFNASFVGFIELCSGKRPAVGATFHSMVPGDLWQLWKERCDQAMQGVKASFEFTVTTKRGPKQFETSLTPICHGNQFEGISVFTRDITERLALEAQLRQIQKMECVGQLAGGVAHDFNNLLTIIHCHAALQLSESENSPAVVDSATEITRAADRASKLTRQLLAFSRKQVMKLESTNISEVVSGTAEMLRPLLGDGIRLELRLAKVPPVLADRNCLEQVLINLSINARDAMRDGGTLTIEVERFTGEQEPLVCVRVTDTGTGIAPEHVGSLFEPFFTTKEIGKGTGLGLATVHGIIKQHEGTIALVETSRNGTTFQISLPVHQKESSTENPVGVPTFIGRGTVLLVEDDEEVRKVVSFVLKRAGFQILEAENGKRALEIWKVSKEEIVLLISDVVMPEGITGHSLAETFRQQRPGLPIITMSGFPNRGGVSTRTVPASGAFIQKPFTPAELLNLVERELSPTRANDLTLPAHSARN